MAATASASFLVFLHPVVRPAFSASAKEAPEESRDRQDVGDEEEGQEGNEKDQAQDPDSRGAHPAVVRRRPLPGVTGNAAPVQRQVRVQAPSRLRWIRK